MHITLINVTGWHRKMYATEYLFATFHPHLPKMCNCREYFENITHKAHSLQLATQLYRQTSFTFLILSNTCLFLVYWLFPNSLSRMTSGCAKSIIFVIELDFLQDYLLFALIHRTISDFRRKQRNEHRHPPYRCLKRFLCKFVQSYKIQKQMYPSTCPIKPSATSILIIANGFLLIITKRDVWQTQKNW